MPIRDQSTVPLGKYPIEGDTAWFFVAGLCGTPLPRSCCEEGPMKPLLVLLAPNRVYDTVISRVWYAWEEDGQG